MARSYQRTPWHERRDNALAVLLVLVLIVAALAVAGGLLMLARSAFA